MNTQAKQFKDLKGNDIITLVFLLLFIIIDFIPFEPRYSRAEPQWLYLSILNLAVLGYLFYTKTFIVNVPKKLNLVNLIPILSSVFLILSAISLVKVINFFEGIITLSRYVIIFISAVNLYFLLNKKTYLLYFIFSMVSILLLLQILNAFDFLKSNYLTMSFSNLIGSMKFNHSNKNIFSSVIFLKLPLILYCIINSNGWKKTFHYFSFALALMMLYILSTRALVLGSFIAFGFYFIFSFKFSITKIVTNLSVLGIMVGCFLVALVIIKNGKLIDGDNVLDRNKEISTQDYSFQLRLNFWKSSFEEMKENPMLGCGVGNWKIKSQKYEYKWKPEKSNAIHMHNDYLEVPAESGILSGLVYLSLFIIIALINLSTMIKTTDKDKKLLILIILTAFIAYGVDSFFNFPLSRPTPLIVFILIIALTMILNCEDDKTYHMGLSSKIAFGTLLLLSVINVYPNYLQNDFYKKYNTFKLDEEKYKMTYEETVALLPKYPNVDLSTTSVTCMQANYLIHEKRFDEALKLIDKIKSDNPYSFYPSNLKAIAFSKMNIQDSVLYYNRNLHYSLPCFFPFYNTYMSNLAVTKDTTEILKTYNDLNLNIVKPDFFKSTFNYLVKSEYDIKKAIKILEKGIELNPKDTMLVNLITNTKKIIKETNNTKPINPDNFKPKDANDYGKLLPQFLIQYKTNPTDFAIVENIGFCYLQIKQYSKAIPYLEKVIQSKTYNNGKSEYMLALCHHNLNQKDKACEAATLAKNKNFAANECQLIINANCK